MSEETSERPIATTIPKLIDEAAIRYELRTAIEDGDTKFTFGELREHARRATAAMIAAGVEKGDRVGVWAPNIWEWIVVALGVHGAGGAIVPLNTRYKGAEARYILQKSGAKLLFAVQGFLGHDYVSFLRDAAQWNEGASTFDALPALEQTVVLRGDTPDGCVSLDTFLSQGEKVSTDDIATRWDGVGQDDLSDLIFTSGTTGNPKGVKTTHLQNLRTFTDWSGIVGLREGDRYLIVNPFFHSFGYKAGWLASIIRGATILPHAVFDAIAVLKRIEAEGVTMLPGPPALYQTILGSTELSAHDISSLRLAVTGAASIPVSLIQRMRDELGFDTVLTAYGLTECCGVVTMCREEDPVETIANTSGRAIPGVEVAIWDAEGNSLAAGEPGEIMVRGYNVMSGYFDDPAKTEETITSDGWLHTGDIGFLDDGGNIQITDRKKDMFIVGGFNAYPAEIENLLVQNPEIVHAAVIGVPDERLGEVGAAYLVLREGAQLTSRDVTAWCRENMANFKVPREVHIVDDLPRNAVGKVLKYQLRENHPGNA